MNSMDLDVGKDTGRMSRMVLIHRGASPGNP